MRKLLIALALIFSLWAVPVQAQLNCVIQNGVSYCSNGVVFTTPNLVTTSTDGLVLRNTTVATAGVPVQLSPRLRLRSNVWNTTATAATNTDDWIIESVPVSGTTPSGLLKLGSSLNGAAYTFPMTLTSSGELRIARLLSLGPIVNNTGVITVTNTGSSPNHLVLQNENGDNFGLLKFGGITSAVPALKRNGAVLQVRLADDSAYAVIDAAAYRINGSAGATSANMLTKKVTAIADNSATTVLTVTVPNGNHAASIKLRFLSSNGGADAFESSRTAEGTVVLARTAGVDTVATAVAVSGEAIATVGSGATHTLAYSITGMTGAADATQTFTIQVTIDDTGNLGASQCVVLVELINAEATGVTVS